MKIEKDSLSLLPAELKINVEGLNFKFDRSISDITVSRFIDRVQFALDRVRLCTVSLSDFERNRVIDVFERGLFDKDGRGNGGERKRANPLVIEVRPTTDANVNAFVYVPPGKVISDIYQTLMYVNFNILRFDPDNVANWEQCSAIILHEMMHIAGFEHPDDPTDPDYGNSAPVRSERCITSTLTGFKCKGAIYDDMKVWSGILDDVDKKC